MSLYNLKANVDVILAAVQAIANLPDNPENAKVKEMTEQQIRLAHRAYQATQPRAAARQLLRTVSRLPQLRAEQEARLNSTRLDMMTRLRLGQLLEQANEMETFTAVELNAAYCSEYDVNPPLQSLELLERLRLIEKRAAGEETRYTVKHYEIKASPAQEVGAN